MKALGKALLRFVKVDSTTETLEWGLVCGLIVVGAIAAITVLGPKVSHFWNNTHTEIKKTP